jgi:hypothetical protein
MVVRTYIETGMVFMVIPSYIFMHIGTGAAIMMRTHVKVCHKRRQVMDSFRYRNDMFHAGGPDLGHDP